MNRGKLFSAMATLILMAGSAWADSVRLNPASEHFEVMVREYANAPIEYPNLKAVTLAMMMLESGRGKSDLATRHWNFAGLKYRKEMSPHAAKVRYKASDGWDEYCEFENPKKFIKGFWAFLDRTPYKGWRQKADSPQAFLNHIKGKYCPFNKQYEERVMALLPEAKAWLAKYEEPASAGYELAYVDGKLIRLPAKR